MKKKLGICFFQNSIDGGIFNFSKILIHNKKLLNKDVVVIFNNENNYKNFPIEKSKKILIGKQNLVMKVINFLFFMFTGRALNIKKDKKLLSDIDYLLLISPSIYPLYFQKNIISIIHDFQEIYFRNYFTLYQKFIRKFLKKLIVEKSSAVIFETEIVKNDLINFYNYRENDTIKKNFFINTLYPKNYVNHLINNLDLQSIEYLKKKNTFDFNKNKYLFYPAQFFLHKNHMNLFKSFIEIQKKFKDLYLVITGYRKYEYQNLINYIKRNNIKNIIHVDYVTESQYFYVFTNCELLVVPTLFESVSLPIYEAFILNKKVCASEIEYLPSQVFQKGKLFNPMSIRSISETIISSLEEKNLEFEKNIHEFNNINSEKIFFNNLNKIIDEI